MLESNFEIGPSRDYVSFLDSSYRFIRVFLDFSKSSGKHSGPLLIDYFSAKIVLVPHNFIGTL